MQRQSGNRGVLHSLALAFVLLGMLSTRVHAADPTPCEPCRWTNDPWSADTCYTVTLDEMYCQAKVYYKTRQCLNDGCYEAKIDSVVFADSCAIQVAGGFADIYKLYHVFYEFLTNDPMSFPPNNAGESSCWRTITPRCWRLPVTPCVSDPNYTYPSRTLIACSDSDCCVMQVVVVKDGCSQLHFHKYPLDEDYALLPGFSDMYDPGNDCDLCTPPAMGGTTVQCMMFCTNQLFDGLINLYSEP